MLFPVGPNDTAATYIQSYWKGIGKPVPHQGWFLAYLFVYSQVSLPDKITRWDYQMGLLDGISRWDYYIGLADGISG